MPSRIGKDDSPADQYLGRSVSHQGCLRHTPHVGQLAIVQRRMFLTTGSDPEVAMTTKGTGRHENHHSVGVEVTTLARHQIVGVAQERRTGILSTFGEGAPNAGQCWLKWPAPGTNVMA